jgi:YD repeat-containing protein
MISFLPPARCFIRVFQVLLFCMLAALELRAAEDTNPPMEDPPKNGPTWTEMSGERFRRIRLDGIPIPAEKEQSKEETDEESEESYVDSLTQAFRHDTSDIYVPLPGGELSLAVKRSSQPELWALPDGGRDGERPVHWNPFTRPFGLGWSSGLCPHIKMETHSGSGDLPHDVIEVSDENGSVYRFAQVFRRPADPNAPVDVAFLPLANNRTSSDNFRNRLRADTQVVNGKRIVIQYVLTRKFGTTLTFDPAPIGATSLTISPTVAKTLVFFRLKQTGSIVDRFGNRLNYAYSAPATLIPGTITWRDANGTGSKILTITSSSSAAGRRVDSIVDPRGNTWNYAYQQISVAGETVNQLWKVTPPAGAVVTYGYEKPPLTQDLRPQDPKSPKPALYFQHFALDTITTGGGTVRMPDGSNVAWTGPSRTTSIAYAWDETTLAYDPPNSTYYNPRASKPRIVVGTSLPGGGGAIFAPSGDPVKLSSGGTGSGLSAIYSVTGARRLTCQDAIGATRVFSYSVNQLVNFNEIEDLFYGTTESDLRNPYVAILWTKCEMTHPDGIHKETVVFDENASLADKVVTDYSGNVTTYEYADNFKIRWFIPWLPPVVDTIPILSPAYRDPTSETRYSVGAPPVVKRFSYYSSGRTSGSPGDITYHEAAASRVMTRITDGLSRATDYVVHPATGRRERETVKEASGAVVKETIFSYTDSRFPGFVTGTQVRNAVRANGVVRDLFTSSTPDAAGNLYINTVDPGGLNLSTYSLYDDNNNKTSETDARGFVTGFAYDAANRLFRTTLPPATLADGSVQPAAMLENGYTPTGKVFWKTDARGTVTLIERDARDRAVATAQATLTTTNLVPRPDGLLPVLPAGAIKTSTFIDEIGKVRSTTDGRGTITTTDYDTMQRPWRVTLDPTGLNLITTYSYTGQNSGGGAFANSTFKPTSTTSPGLFTTTLTYDGLYRPVKTWIQLGAGRYSFSKRVYDAAGNETERHVWREVVTTATSEPTSAPIITKTTYDALNRPLVVTEGFGTGVETVTTTSYDAAAAWQVVKADGAISRVTQTDYDAAGRATHVWSPSAATGLVNRAHPNDPVLGSGVTVTGYDENGNVTAVSDVLQHVTRTIFDQRNRAYRVAVNHLTGNPAVPSELPLAGDLVTSTLYDQAGNSIGVTDPRGYTTSKTFDRANRNTSVTTPVAPVFGEAARALVSSTEFDTNGNVSAAIDGAGAVTRNVYDRANRLTFSAVNHLTGLPAIPTSPPLAGDIVTRNDYDNEGNLYKVTDGLGQVTEFTYDGLKRKTSVIWDANDVTRRKTDQITSHDSLVQLSQTDARGRVMNSYYDARLRLTGIECVGTATDSRTLILDRAGRVTKVLHGGFTLPDTTVLTANVRHAASDYDFLDRVTGETSAGVSHSYQWDKGGNRTLVTYGVTGRTIISEYDKLNRLKLLTEKLPAETIPRLTSYGYDGNGNLLTKTHGNGTAEVTTYDSLNRRETHQVTAGATVLSNFGFFHDAASSVARIVESYDPTAGIAGRTVTNLYDFTRRLKLETSVDAAKTVATTYVYDAANNRTDKLVATTPAGGSC